MFITSLLEAKEFIGITSPNLLKASMREVLISQFLRWRDLLTAWGLCVASGGERGLRRCSQELTGEVTPLTLVHC